jgi:hypothetical protein
MTRPRPAPPSGHPPPLTATLPDGATVDLAALAGEVCARYEAEYPDERDRYGPAGHQWCLHDNQHLLNWAVLEQGGWTRLDDQVQWLAGVLRGRDFPLDRLARDLDLCADVVRERLGVAAEPMAVSVAAAGEGVRRRSSRGPSA